MLGRCSITMNASAKRLRTRVQIQRLHQSVAGIVIHARNEKLMRTDNRVSSFARPNHQIAKTTSTPLLRQAFAIVANRRARNSRASLVHHFLRFRFPCEKQEEAAKMASRISPVFFSLVLSCGLAFGYGGSVWRRHFHELKIVEALSDGKFGISVSSSKPQLFGLMPSRVTNVSLFGNKSIPVIPFRALLEFEKLESVNVSLSNVTTIHFNSASRNAAIRKIVAVRCRGFDNNSFDDCCSRFPALEFLDITDSSVSELGGVSVGRLKMLKTLNASGTEIGDETVTKLVANCLAIEEIDLAGTDIGNNSIRLLMTLPNLRTLDVSKTLINVESLMCESCPASLRHLTYWSRVPIERSLQKDVKEHFKNAQVTIGPVMRE